MKERIDALMHRPTVAHIMAAVDRYNKRLGPQFAAAVTYFSVLSMVPILLFGVAMLGWTLTVLRPDLLALVQQTIIDELGNNALAEEVGKAIEYAFKRWRGLAVTAFLTAAYSGTNWVGNLKRAFRVMWRDRFSEASEKKNFFAELLENFAIFVGLLLSIAIAFTITSAGGIFSEQVIDWLGWQDVPGISVLLRIGSNALVLVASWLLFAFLFLVLPGQGAPVRVWLTGTIAGAVLVTALQQVAGLVIGIFSGNAAAAVFGPLIVVMLLFNILATIIMMVAGWVGTQDTWPEWLRQRDEDAVTGVERGDEVEIDDDHTVPDDRRVRLLAGERWAATKPLSSLRVASYDPEDPPALEGTHGVPPEIAARSVRAGLGVGWGVGAATGVGIGAAITALVGWFSRR